MTSIKLMKFSRTSSADFCVLTKSLLIVLIALTFALVGCSEKASVSTNLNEKYPGNIQNVNKVEIINGGTGETKTVTDYEVVKDWINQVKSIPFKLNPNQEKHDGFAFTVHLFERDDKRLSFTPNSIDEVYYITDFKLLDSIKELYHECREYSRFL